MIKEHDRVILKEDLPDQGLVAGDIGTVLHIYRDGMGYAVEFISLKGDTVAVVTLKSVQIRHARLHEIPHARVLVSV